MSYLGIHFDAKTAIARTSIAAWNAIMRADPEFGRYALSERGRSAFLDAFTVIEGDRWTVGGKLHRVGGPALIKPEYAMPFWYLPGRTEEWHERGELHRIGGPAITYPNGTKKWYENGQQHRIGGPACTFGDGSEEWCENGKLHRVGGPARIHASGGTEYWERGVPADPQHATRPHLLI